LFRGRRVGVARGLVGQSEADGQQAGVDEQRQEQRLEQTLLIELQPCRTNSQRRLPVRQCDAQLQTGDKQHELRRQAESRIWCKIIPRFDSG
jgi:hypothetical protein